MINWFITNYQQVPLENGFRIEFTTDWPAHLSCYWTTFKPWTHRRTGSRRGLLANFLAYFCFVSWQKVEQTEPGGSFYHSFLLDNWPYCETRWFVFSGSIYHTPTYFEPWGATLTENHPWEENGFLFGSHTALSDGQCSIYNDRQLGINISLALSPNEYLLKSLFDDPLLIAYHSTLAQYDFTDGWLSLYFETTNGLASYLVEPLIARGSRWGPWGTYKSASPTVFAYDLGRGPLVHNLLDAWIEGRTLAGLDPDPQGWYLETVRVANEQWASSVIQIITTDYIDLQYAILFDGIVPSNNQHTDPLLPPGPIVSPSISPIFEKHNLHTPPPSGFFIPALHERLRTPRTGGWQDIKWTDNTPLKDHLPPTTVALCLHCKNEGASKAFGLRPKDSIHERIENITVLAHEWAVVGVNDQIEAQLYESGMNPVELYFEGYILEGAAVMFANPKDRTPPGDLAWVTVNVSDICPNAIGIIAEITTDVAYVTSGIRYNHSSDDIKVATGHLFAVIGCDRFQQIEFYTYDHAGKKGHLHICGYILNAASFYIDGLDKTPSTTDTWENIAVERPAQLAFFQVVSDPDSDFWLLRAKGSTFAEYRLANPRQSFAIIPVDIYGCLEGFVRDPCQRFYQVGEGH